MATKLFGASFPELFGNLGTTMFSLFQLMTLEGWAGEIVRPVMAQYPSSWLFFIPFILIVTFTVLNLFIAVIVGAMQAQHDAERGTPERAASDDREAILAEIRALRRDFARIERRLERLPSTRATGNVR
jgi:voltage-gated sodium channel